MVNTVVLNYFQSSACVSVSFVLNFQWNDSYASNNSREFKLLKLGMAIVVSGSVIYNESCIISRFRIDHTRASVSHKHFSCHNLLWKVMTFSQSISLSLSIDAVICCHDRGVSKQKLFNERCCCSQVTRWQKSNCIALLLLFLTLFKSGFFWHLATRGGLGAPLYNFKIDHEYGHLKSLVHRIMY